jgi:hypothetical protein
MAYKIASDRELPKYVCCQIDLPTQFLFLYLQDSEVSATRGHPLVERFESVGIQSVGAGEKIARLHLQLMLPSPHAILHDLDSELRKFFHFLRSLLVRYTIFI